MHRHPFRKIQQSSKFLEIKSFVEDLPIIEKSMARKLVMREYGLSPRSYRYYMSKIQKLDQPDFSFDNFRIGLERDHDLAMEPFPLPSRDSLPDTFIAISPSMKRLFGKFPERIAIDLTFNLIREREVKIN